MDKYEILQAVLAMGAAISVLLIGLGLLKLVMRKPHCPGHEISAYKQLTGRNYFIDWNGIPEPDLIQLRIMREAREAEAAIPRAAW